MLFSEFYGSYFNVVAAVLREAVEGTLTEKRLLETVREKAFAESILTIPTAIRNDDWGLLTKRLKTPLKHVPKMPLTTLQKRWMKTILNDPRIRLFSPSVEGLEDVEPLYSQDDIVWFDRYCDSDPYESPAYIEHFRTILQALHERRKLRITFVSATGKENKWVCVPYRLEYSAKDDKFRLLTAERYVSTVNLARISYCELLEPHSDAAYHAPQMRIDTAVLEVTDERNALERVMLHFSHLEKEAVRVDETHYRLAIRYNHEDETEILIRILSFGSVVRVLPPSPLIAQLRERLQKQQSLTASAFSVSS